MPGRRHTIQVTKNPIGFFFPSQKQSKRGGKVDWLTGEIILASIDTNGSGKKQLLIL